MTTDSDAPSKGKALCGSAAELAANHFDTLRVFESDKRWRARLQEEVNAIEARRAGRKPSVLFSWSGGMNPYEVLGVKRDSTQGEIKHAFEDAWLYLRWYGSVELQQQVKKAYEVLSDPKRRERYDRSDEEANTFIFKLKDGTTRKKHDLEVRGQLEIAAHLGYVGRKGDRALRKALDNPQMSLSRVVQRVPGKGYVANQLVLAFEALRRASELPKYVSKTRSARTKAQRRQAGKFARP